MRLSPGMRDNLTKQKGKVASTTTVDTESLHIKLIEFEKDRQHMRSHFTQRAERTDYKRNTLISKYKPYVERFLASGDRIDNPIFSHLTVWLFDVGELETAIAWCLKAIELDLPTPENFRRGWPTICADEVLEWAQRESERGNSVQPYFGQVFELIENTWRINEEIHCKWLKFAGLSLLRNAEGVPQPTSVGDIETLQKAKALLLKAHELYAKAGVKTTIIKIDQRIRALESGKNL